jgi:indoleamine 2,3-dioxygenase
MQRGFLPHDDPALHLPAEYDPWERTALELPKLLASGTVRQALDRLPALDATALTASPELAERGMLLLSYFGHAYVWGGAAPAARLPAALAVPWHTLSQGLGRPPVLSYASYALYNWRRLQPEGPIALGNLALLQNFLGGVDEEWFVLVHVEIEAKAAAALEALRPLQAAAALDDRQAVLLGLRTVAVTLEEMHATLARMPERCDPYIYYHRVRPYIHGWKDQPALAAGVVYEGVGEYGGKPQRFRGETGAQSTIIPSLDAALGIHHPEGPLSEYLREMREYMPPGHRQFLDLLERGPQVRRYVMERVSDSPLREAYNRCVLALARFRALHLEYADRYIHQQHEKNAANPTGLGTGGTPFMQYLEEHRATTMGHTLPGVLQQK